MRSFGNVIDATRSNNHLLRESLLLVAVALTAYVGAFHGAFQFDDVATILDNPHLDRWQTFFGHLDHMVRPVLYGTFLIDRSIYGNSASGYHLLNLLLHLGSGLLIYRILAHTVMEETRYIPFWTAALFLIHPIQTEAVTYISGRATGLMALFYLLALFFYIEAAARPRDSVLHRRYIFSALLSCVFALGSKETAMTFPLALLLRDIVIRRLDWAALGKTVLSNHLPFWFVLIPVAAWVWWHPRYSTLAQFSLTLRPLWDNFLSETHAVVFALMLYFCPWKQNFDHDLPVLHSPFQWPLPLDLLVLGGIAAAALVAVRRLPLFSFGIGWCFVQLLPTSLIPRVDLLSERNLYLASFGLVLAIVVLGTRLVEWLTTVLPQPKLIRFSSNSAAVIFILVLCLFTYQRNMLYRDQVSLWSDTVQKSPNKARPHNNLGHSYALRDEWDLAIEEFRTAARLDPDYVLAQNNLRDAYLHRVGRL